MNSKIPVLNKSGAVVGHTTTTAHNIARALSGAKSVRQEFRLVNGIKRFCWVPN